MKYQIPTRIFYCALLQMIVAWCTIANAQEGGTLANGTRCLEDAKGKKNFKVVFEDKNSLPPYSVTGYIFIKREKFNRESMASVLDSLNSRYCQENHVSVAIFDDKSRAKDTDIIAYSLGKIREPAVRGFYWLDRVKGISGIKYSTARGNPIDEEKIERTIDDQ